MNFYRVAQTQYAALKAMIDATLHSREIHAHARHINEHPSFFTPVERAWAVWVCTKLGFASMIDGTFGYDRSGTTTLKLRNAKEAFTEELCSRLGRVTVECEDGIDVIRRYDCPEAFHFVDPPYVGSDCRALQRHVRRGGFFEAARYARDGRREIHAYDVPAREDRTPRRPARLDDPSARPHHHRLERSPAGRQEEWITTNY